MSHEFLLWIATTCYAAHVIEEYVYDWRTWASTALRLAVTWENFYLANAAVIVTGIASASVGWRAPAFSLSFPALMVINALFFHIGPTLFQRRFSPGLLTSVLLFVPVGLLCYRGALVDGVAGTGPVIWSLIIGTAIMAFPIVLIKTASLRVFRQPK